MIDPQKFEKQKNFETTQLATAVYKALSAGESALKVQQDLIYKGVDRETAEYVVNYIHQKKRWHIAWHRAGSGLKLTASGLGSLLLAGFILLIGFVSVRELGGLYPDFSRLLLSLILFASILLAVGGSMSLGVGIFRLLTASSDTMAGCLPAVLISLIVLLVGVLVYLLLSLL